MQQQTIDLIFDFYQFSLSTTCIRRNYETFFNGRLRKTETKFVSNAIYNLLLEFDKKKYVSQVYVFLLVRKFATLEKLFYNSFLTTIFSFN